LKGKNSPEMDLTSENNNSEQESSEKEQIEPKQL
jgi:hypothetical protein